MEVGYSDTIRNDLTKRGHNITELKAIGGGMGLIEFSEAGMTGASCWRADGTPIGVAGGTTFLDNPLATRNSMKC